MLVSDRPSRRRPSKAPRRCCRQFTGRVGSDPA